MVDYLFDETTAQPLPKRVSNTLEVIHRLRTVSSWSRVYWYANQNLNEFPDVEFRYLIIPSVETKKSDDAKKEDIMAIFSSGIMMPRFDYQEKERGNEACFESTWVF